MFRELRLYALMEVGEDEDTIAAGREWRLGMEHSEVGPEPATLANQQQPKGTYDTQPQLVSIPHPDRDQALEPALENLRATRVCKF